MTAENYLKETEPAIKGLLDLLAYYEHLTHPPSLVPFVDERGVVILSRNQAQEYMQAYSDALALDVSKASLAGSILQIACKALQEFSKNTILNSAVLALGLQIKPEQARYAVGREILGIPAGLLIYAGRIQYNHYEEGYPKNPTARSVFDRLLTYYANDLTFDMAYELEWPAPRPVSHYIVRHELKWLSINDYHTDMKNMLSLE